MKGRVLYGMQQDGSRGDVYYLARERFFTHLPGWPVDKHGSHPSPVLRALGRELISNMVWYRVLAVNRAINHKEREALRPVRLRAKQYHKAEEH